MISKPNLSVLILLLLLVQLTVGCSGRKGPFIQLGGGMAAVYANQEWTSTKIVSGKVIERNHHESTVILPGLSGNFKIGVEITEQLLVSPSLQMSRLSSLGWGITVFQKKNAPSLFVDIVIPVSIYFPTRFPLSESFQGRGGSVGIGYEFKKNWTVQANFSHGKHEFAGSDVDETGEFIVNLLTLGLAGEFVDKTRYDARSTGYSLGFTISYIWY